MKPTVFGAAYSVYARIARLALEEKAVDYALEEVDIFAPGGPPASYLERQPFGRIPSFEHEGFRLYETAAITRYVDRAFPGTPLQPASPRDLARMDQVIAILDSYAYRTLVWDIFVERVRAPTRGRAPDEARIADALAKARTVLGELNRLRAERPYLAGETLTLADIHAAPMFVYFAMAPEGAELLKAIPGLSSWCSRIAARPSLARTRSPFE